MHSVKYSNQQQYTDGLTCFSLYFMQVAIYTYNLATNFSFNCGFLFTICDQACENRACALLKFGYHNYLFQYGMDTNFSRFF